MSWVVMRASHAHQMPQITRPQRLPVARFTSVNMVPTSTAETAMESHDEFLCHEEGDTGQDGHSVEAERRYGGGHVDEDDPVDIALKSVGRDHNEDLVEIPEQQQSAENSECIDQSWFVTASSISVPFREPFSENAEKRHPSISPE